MKVLLDTCTFLWILWDAPELSAIACAHFRNPANQVFLSCVSVWEICVKYQLGRLDLPADPLDLVPRQRARHGVAALSLDEAAVMQSLKLPDLHRDPFDRMLVAQSVAEGMALLTPDPLITRYPVRTLW